MTRTTIRRTVSAPASGMTHPPQDGFLRNYEKEPQDDLVLPADSMTMSPDNLQERVHTTQQRLTVLRAEADALEREKQQFEELSRQQRDFMQGRTEMAEKLSRSIAMLDRESYEAQKRVEQLLTIKDSFHQYLEVVGSLNPEQWNPQELQHDLTRALGMIEDARGEYQKAIARVHMLTNAPAPALPAAPASSSGGVHSESSASRAAGLPVEISGGAFRIWVFCGTAFTLPLIVMALLYLLIRMIG